MKDQFFTWVLALPLGVILGWIANRLFGPSADALGQSLLNSLSILIHKKDMTEKNYLILKNLIERNHNAEVQKSRFIEKKTYCHDMQIVSLLRNIGFFLKRSVKDEFIKNSKINSYHDSDIFFAAMELFINELKKKDLQKIFQKYKKNDQATLWPFLELIEEKSVIYYLMR